MGGFSSKDPTLPCSLHNLLGTQEPPQDPLQMGRGQRPGACIIMNILNNTYVLLGIPL